MKELVVMSNTVFTVFWIMIVAIYGLIPSISHSFYELPEKARGLFTFTLWSFAIPMMIVGEHGLMFFAGASICFVGAAADYRNELTDTVHYVCAVLSIALGILYWGFKFDNWYVGIPIVISAAVLYPILRKRATLWVEIVAYYCITLPFYYYL